MKRHGRPVTHVSLYCGAGGESEGLKQAFQDCGIDVSDTLAYAVNHWDLAVGTHALNIPHVAVRQEDLTEVTAADFGLSGERINLLWGSPSCTHHSRARGGKPKDNQLRSHPWDIVDRWIDVADVQAFFMENVAEIMDWGPLYEDHSDGCTGYLPGPDGELVEGCLLGCHYHHPIPELRGWEFMGFLVALMDRGYQVEYRILNAADFGAPTTRKRFFLIAVRDGLPIAWPTPTHRNPKAKPGVYDPSLPAWKSAASCIDWSDLGTSIFERDRELADATKKRIASGIVKYVLNGKPFILRTDMHKSNAGCVYDPADPLHTITTGGGHAVCTPIVAGVSGRAGQSDPRTVDRPYPTVTTKADAVIVSPLVAKLSHGTDHGQGVQPADDPLRTQTGQQDKALIAPVLAYLRGTGDDQIPNTVASPEDPVRTLSAGGTHAALIAPLLATVGYGERPGQAPRTQDVQDPLGTVVAGGVKSALVAPILTSYHGAKREGDARGGHMDAPLPTADTSNRFGLVAPILASIDQQSTGDSAVRSPEDPLSTAVTKNRHALVAATLMTNTSGHAPTSLDRPVPTITTGDQQTVVAAFLEKGFGGPNGHQTPGASVADPMPSVTTRDHSNLVAAFLTSYYSSGGQGQQLDDPMHTVTTLARHGLVTVNIDGTTYVITDIRMRMLKPAELARAMGFPETYRWVRQDGKDLSDRDAVKMIGNAVPPPMAAALIRAHVDSRPESFNLRPPPAPMTDDAFALAQEVA